MVYLFLFRVQQAEERAVELIEQREKKTDPETDEGGVERVDDTVSHSHICMYVHTYIHTYIHLQYLNVLLQALACYASP